MGTQIHLANGPEVYVFLGGYEEAMRACQRDLRIGCIIIVSEEHEDISEFKRCVHQRDRYLVPHYRAGRL